MICKELRKDGFDLADGRYRELKPILDEVISVINIVHRLEKGIATNLFFLCIEIAC